MAQAITVIGGNCYQIAAQYLGDATLFVQIMDLNGLTDPFINGQVTLQLPDPSGLTSGGTIIVDTSFPFGASVDS